MATPDGCCFDRSALLLNSNSSRTYLRSETSNTNQSSVVINPRKTTSMPASTQVDWMIYESSFQVAQIKAVQLSIFPVQDQGVSGSLLFALKWKL